MEEKKKKNTNKNTNKKTRSKSQTVSKTTSKKTTEKNQTPKKVTEKNNISKTQSNTKNTNKITKEKSQSNIKTTVKENQSQKKNEVKHIPQNQLDTFNDVKLKTEVKIKRRLKKKFVVAILIFFILLSLFSLYKVILWTIDNNRTSTQIEEIHETVEVEEVVEETNTESVEINPPEEVESDYWYYIKMPLISVDFEELLQKNKDTIGWIQVNGTNINYPIVQTEDNDYYLTHSFDKKYNDAGWIFMDFRNDINNLSKNNIIYGHSRLDRTMFGSLKNITKSNWYKNKDNYIIKLSTPTKNTMWQVFSVYRIPTESYYITTDFYDDSEYQTFIDTISGRSFMIRITSKTTFIPLPLVTMMFTTV